MLQFGMDYGRGAHPEILNRIIDLNMRGTEGYGEDEISEIARRKILNECGLRDGMVFFLVGGTQTNAVAIDWLLHRGEGVIATDTSHINVHESGAIEEEGHKVITLESDGAGCLDAAALRQYLSEFYSDPTWPHMVLPGMVYISQPTELGTLYTYDQLAALREVCDEYELKLYVDGARLVYALGSPENNVSLHDIAALTDAFYIGGTKCGTLFGEALVIPGYCTTKERMRLFNLIKRHGALLAKGWLTAAQFDVLIGDGLYKQIGKEAVAHALRLKEELCALGLKPFIDSPTNQQFFTLPNEAASELSRSVAFDTWGSPGPTHTKIRLVTDWSTTSDTLSRLLEYIRQLPLS